MNRTLKHIIFFVLLLLTSGAAVAQTDSPYVLKKNVTSGDSGTLHYLAHVKNGGTWVLQDATTFDPQTCIWYSGPKFNITGNHHNYYFYDEVADKYHFLTAPFATAQDPGLSLDLPTSAQLKNPEDIYYFYDWDGSGDPYDGGGVARGHDDNGWWEVHWIAYSNHASKWTTTAHSYHITDSSARFHQVTITQHERAVNWTTCEVGNLSNFQMNYDETPANTEHPLSITIDNYSYTCTPAYMTYTFEGIDNNFWDNTNHGTNTPNPSAAVTSTSVSYEWTVRGAGKDYLSFSSTVGSNDTISTLAAPKLYYTTENIEGDKTATLTLKLTFSSGETLATLVREAVITVKTPCQNPAQAAEPVVNFNDVTVRWYDVAEKYKVEWKPSSAAWTVADSVKGISHNYYTITDLTPGTEYEYRVTAFCGSDYETPPTTATGSFTPEEAPDLLVYGAVFGGGRMADVEGNTEVVVVNCDSIGAVYGGNDIAGTVKGSAGSSITLGVHSGDDYASALGTTDTIIKIGSVYGGGNGYYIYNGTSFEPAVEDTVYVANNVSVKDLAGNIMWTNTSGDYDTLAIPSIKKTAITVTDSVRIDSLFGGAKNAFLTLNNAAQNGSSITVKGGIVFGVFGGNNVGGSQGAAKQHIEVINTETDLTTTKGLGRTHGIAYLFGGGNKVAGSTTDVVITGGQLDTIFAGGNQASVGAAQLQVNCTGNKLISAALTSGGTIDPNYGWDGDTIYNVHTLFGGNNRADMNGVPTVTLTSGGVGTVYGGGNAGDMLADTPDSGNSNAIATAFGVDITGAGGNPVKYSTHVVVPSTSSTMIVDNLYGGCQVSNVDYSTWVEIQGGHIGTVYGGCNVSGDVGSVCLNPNASAFIGPDEEHQSPNPEYQEVRGATYVDVSGGTIYRNLFAGSNGYYHCNDGVSYISGLNYGDPDGYPVEYDPQEQYVGLPVPTHNETNVKVSLAATVYGNVYAGGNLACVGFTDYTVPQGHVSGDGKYPQFVGMATIQMTGGRVYGDVFGGGNMASIYGSNSVKVSGGRIDGALYGGNDRTGQVAQITNRVLPSSFDFASDGYTGLKNLNVKTYVSLTGTPTVETVYGGGNGDYLYTGPNAIQFCGLTPDEPIQANTFVDINIDNDGHIETVYGGGNGVTVIGGITVFLNVNNPDFTASHVGKIFGGNNKGSLSLIPDIVLLKGQVDTVYGGCNQGAMEGWETIDNTYHDVGSLVRLRNVYTAYDNNQTPGTVNANTDVKITGAVYGGCRMNGVSHNSLVLVEGGNHTGTTYPNIFGGSDISGEIEGASRVVVKGGAVNNIFGGGNGNYLYDGNKVYTLGNVLIDSIESGTIFRPACGYTQVDMIAGTAANLYGGGNAAGVKTTSTVNMNGGNVTAGLYGGCCSMDTIHGDVTVNVLGGTVGTDATHRADIFGGGYGQHTRTGGNVEVNVSRATGENPPAAPILYGDIYGGSALGHVNDTLTTTHTTTVNILDGTVNGTVYGGGLGQKEDGENPAIAALVQGKTYVNIGATNGAANPTYSGNATITGDVYGCNNLNGSPMDSVFVNIYQTAHGSGPAGNAYPTNIAQAHNDGDDDAVITVADLEYNSKPTNQGGQGQTYAINAVYGGGNQAAYMPDTLADGRPKCSTVHIYDCRSNTVQYVFGGGNAADVGYLTSGNDTVHANTLVVIDGGRIHQVFGGGNGAGVGNPGADIFGVARTEIFAGLIDEVFGGANMRGSVDEIDLNVEHSDNSCDEVYGKVFGCANYAPYNKSVTTTIYCGVGTIGEIYGGSNMAYIGDPGNHNSGVNVTLNLYGGGPYNNVYAGSKGVQGGTAADIYGNVTLNLYGGTMERAFGGSDQNGNITGTVTVNVLDFEDGSCPLRVDTIFGASNLAAYEPDEVSTDVKRTSPVVNMMHIKNETDPSLPAHYIGNIFGGGNRAVVNNANPMVNVGYDATTMQELIPDNYPTGNASTFNTAPRAYVDHDVFGGGNKDAVTGTDTVNLKRSNSHVEHIFGGGNDAGTTHTVVNVYDGTVASAVYGGCNNVGTVTGDIKVNIYDGTLGTSGAPMPEGIFGGGKGNNTHTNGNVTVTIGEGTTPEIYAEIYGGSAFGQVGAATKTAKVDLKNGTIHGNIFGGGKGQLAGTNPVTPAYSAEVTGNAQVVISDGAVLDSVFGGCNVNGIVKGNAIVEVTGGTLGAAESGTLGDPGYVAEVRSNVYGGGLGVNTKVKGSVEVTVNNPSGHIYGDVYGGSAKGLVNCNEAGNAANDGSTTTVTLTDGTIHGNLYGGGHGPNDGENAHVYGPVTVNVNGSTAQVMPVNDNRGGSVFGGNNLRGTPQSTITVNLSDGTVKNVFGGGDQAAYSAPSGSLDYPAIYISGGTVTHKVVGGCNAADVTGNPHVNISGGNLCTVSTGSNGGVFGGCNASGTVDGSITVNITGSNSSQTTIGNQAALNARNPVGVFGGGYGEGTATTGDITVIYGGGGQLGTDCDYPKLYGDLYGGSALGTVNSNATSPANTTTVTLLNGSFVYVRAEKDQYGGNIFGGGLGQVGEANMAKGQVNGKVQVNVGIEENNAILGKVNLKGCNVFGCNNTNGSPKQEVHVDVYQTKHTVIDSVSATASEWDNYAIRNVYGGGNKASYIPANGQLTYNTVHQCENTIQNVYGGGNAADTYGTVVSVDGGRFQYIFGGGNGQTTWANILEGGVNIAIYGGHIGWYFSGCNLHGNIGGGNPTEQYGCTDYCPCGDSLVVENYYFGANEAITVGGLSHIINCGDNMEFTNVYGGSRLAAVYGDIKLWVRGGSIKNLFAGNEGSDEVQADVKRYPLFNYDWDTNPDGHPEEVHEYLNAHSDLNLWGKGGNIQLVLEGGKLGSVYGGNNYRGNVEGDIVIIVDSTQTEAICTLEIDTLYGGNKKAGYTPDNTLVDGHHQVCLTDRVSPRIYLKKGHVNYDVYGGSEGGDPDHQFGNGLVVSNSMVVVGDPENTDKVVSVGRDVFGGGSAANLEGNPVVVIQGKAMVGGDVYGGGRQGDIIGETDVKIAPIPPDTIQMPTTPVPPTHILTIVKDPSGGGTVEVKYSQGGHEVTVNSGDAIPEGSILQIKATPNPGYSFSEWTTNYGKIEQPTHASTQCLMGSQDTTLTATFTSTKK